MKTLNDSELSEVCGGFESLNQVRPVYQPAIPTVDLGGGDGSPRHVDN